MRPAAFFVLALIWAALRGSKAQMESPLKGRGVPRPETQNIFVSTYLDRLLDVNEDNYRWEAVIYFYLSWIDNSAYQITQANSIQLLTNTSFQCGFYCSNVWEQALCCDGFYLPSFAFKNAYGFPQDREVMYNLYPADDGSLLWEVRVHGIFYQPMDFSHFPFDSFDLAVELRFYDPTLLIQTDFLFGVNSSGVTIVPSSGGKKLYTIGRGDDASSWAVTDYQLKTYKVDMGSWFSEYSDLVSDPEDPMPLAPLNANGTGELVDEEGNPVNVFTGVTDQLIAVLITVERFWKPSLINAVLPVVLVFTLGMMIFVTRESALDTRLEIVVTLFLALTAVQFVVIGHMPTSSYVVPTQQLVLATYIFLFVLAMESIAVFYIVCGHENKLRAKRRKEAWRRWCLLRDQGKLKGGQNPDLASAVSDLHEGLEEEQLAGSMSSKDADAAGAAQEAQHGGFAAFNCGSCFGSRHQVVQQGGSGDSDELTAAENGHRAPRKRFGAFSRKPQSTSPWRTQSATAMRQMTADEAFGQHVGHVVDNVFAAFLGIGYCVTTILIFTLQSGYIELFPDDLSN